MNLLITALLSSLTCVPTVEPKYSTSIVEVVTIPINNTTADKQIMATAFAISPNLLMTAGHFCVDAVKLMATGQSEIYIAVIKAGPKHLEPVGKAVVVDWASPEIDTCILGIEAHGLKPIEIANNTDSTLIEESITVIGAPEGILPIRQNGWIISLDSGELFNFKNPVISNKIVISIRGAGGLSGAPVIQNSTGKVIGIVTHITKDRLVMATKSEDIWTWIKSL